MQASSAAAATRRELLERMTQARAETSKLFGLVKPAFLYERPIAERNRIVFYLGHLEAFDWNLLHEFLGIPAFDPSLDKLFAFGIDPVDGVLPTDQVADWPTEAQISSYNRQIRTRLDEALLSTSRVGHANEDLAQLLHVAIEHRWMHAETLSYLLHRMPLNNLIGAVQAAPPDRGPCEPETVHVPAGRATLGMERAQGPGEVTFGWDNEFELFAVDVSPFAIDRYKITNGQFLEFTRAGGYQDPGLWTDADWRWKEGHGIEHPAFWRRDGAEFRYRALFDVIPLPMEWPAYVSHAEASAYAAWAGKRLPTEAEWHRAAYGAPDSERIFPWGSSPPSAARGYLDMHRWDPSPVNAFPDGRSGWGIDGMLASGWEWTSTLFSPFHGFEPFPFYPGYSANFFDGKHYVMKGGSPRTHRCMLRRSFRNWFQPRYQYAYAGFRCVSKD